MKDHKQDREKTLQATSDPVIVENPGADKSDSTLQSDANQSAVQLSVTTNVATV